MIITYKFVRNLLVEQYKNSITDSVIILLKTPLEWKKRTVQICSADPYKAGGKSAKGLIFNNR